MIVRVAKGASWGTCYLVQFGEMGENGQDREGRSRGQW